MGLVIISPSSTLGCPTIWCTHPSSRIDKYDKMGKDIADVML